MSAAFKLRTIGKPLAKAFSGLFSNARRDSRTVQRTFTGTDRGGSEIEIDPVSVDLAKLRHQHREEAIESLIEAFTSESNALVIGTLMMDSMREEFPLHTDPTTDQIQTFLKDMDVVSFKDCLTGLAKANAKVFGPLGKQIASAAKEAFEIDEALDEQIQETSSAKTVGAI